MNFIRARVENGSIRIHQSCLNVTANLGCHAQEYEGKEICFGFRPEAAVLGSQENAFLLDAKVELTEMLGDNTNVYINVQEDKAILKVDPHDTPEMDAQLTFSIPYDSVYLFDGETEKVLK